MTFVLNWKRTPLAAAFSAKAMVRPKGQTIAPVGAQRAATASGEMFGSSSRRRSRSTISRPGHAVFHAVFVEGVQAWAVGF